MTHDRDPHPERSVSIELGSIIARDSLMRALSRRARSQAGNGGTNAGPATDLSGERDEPHGEWESRLADLDRLVLQTADEGFALFSSEDPPRLESFNHRFAAIFDLDPDWLRERPTVAQWAAAIYDRHHRSSGDPKAYIDRVVRQHAADSVREIELRLNDGRFIVGRNQPAPDGGRLYTFRDITIERRVLGELQAERQRLSLMVEHGPVAFYVVDCPTNVCVEIGRAIQHLTGHAAEELIGVTREWGHLIHPDDWPGVRDRLREAVVRHQPYDLEYRIHHTSGGVRWFRDMAEPVPDFEGLPPQMAGVLVDITRTKAAEHGLRESERKFRELIEGITDVMFYEHDSDRRLTYVSPSSRRIIGRDPEELVGSRFGDTDVGGTGGGEGLVLARASVSAAIQSGRRQPTYEVRINHSDGRPVVLEVMEYPVTSHGEVHGFRGVARDVTEIRNMERRLRERERLAILGTFAGGLAHDLNNLLLPIRAGLDALERDPDPTRVHERVSVVRRATDHIAELTGKLLVWTRQESAGKSGIIVRDVRKWAEDVSGLLSDAVTSESAHQAVIKVHMVVDRPPRAARIDPDLLKQAVLNLVLNARDAMPEGGTIAVRVERSPGCWFLQTPHTVNAEVVVGDPDARRLEAGEEPCGDGGPGAGGPPGARGSAATAVEGPDAPVARPALRISVADTGCGMDADTLRRAFDPFFSTKTRGKSTGLGLALVNSIIRSVGGMVNIESRLGSGTTVTLDVPADREEAVSTESLSRVPRGGGALISLGDPWQSAFVRSCLAALGLVPRIDADAVPGTGDVVWVFDPERHDPGELRATVDTFPDVVLVSLAAPDPRPGWPQGIIWLSGTVDSATIRQRLLERIKPAGAGSGSAAAPTGAATADSAPTASGPLPR